jgi:Fe-S cluster assembly iron-binding protein IscA
MELNRRRWSPRAVQIHGRHEIDVVDDLIGATLKINNSVAIASCGNGTSFTV